ncbi:MAG: hypothetical protein J6Q54_02720, partial [Oscillospiraceae bacterium]|nr:hypothetical protein [Oscillospiraceae bacterium]
TADRPYTVVYGAPNNYLRQEQEGGAMLKATLVPKKFAVNLDLNLGDDTDTPVYGLEKYMVDSKSGEARYAFMHTWSFAESFVAYPYREGYVFDGWESPNEEDVYIKDGVIYVGTILDHDITLTAKWKKLSGTDYTIRYLELNTDKVLQGATMVSGAVQGSKILATDCATPIEGYVYAGALVGGIYADKDKNPAMTVAEDPSKNLMVIYYLPDGSDGYTEQVESNLEINKSAVLENDGTYTITLDTYTKDNPITTLIQQNTPLDIVLVMDQSESVIEGMYLDDLQAAVDNFVDMVSAHGQANKVDHRIALVGYAGDEDSQAVTDTSWRPIAGGNTSEWVNTGIFDSNGVFHPIYITGFNYTRYEGDVYPTEETENGTVKTVYYALAHDVYVLLTYHETYYHLITPEEARLATLSGTQVYGQVGEKFIELTRNSSGLWLDKDKQLYSQQEFFTLHEDVWTHRHDTERREIHAYGTGKNYREMDDHSGVYVREITKEANPELSVYRDALIPVSASLNGSGGLNPSLENAGERLASNGQTYPQYGIRMANQVLAANPLEEGSDRIRIVVLFTDGMPGDGNFSEEEANAAIAEAYKTKNDYGAYLYTVGLYTDATVAENAYQAYFMNAVSYNYPEAETMDDVRAEFTYTTAPDISSIETGGPYFVIEDGQAYELTFGLKYENKIYYYCWYYVGHNGRVDVHVVEGSRQDPAIVDGKIGNFEIFKKSGSGYQPTEHSGYYSIMNSASELDRYFTNIVQDITTKVTTEIVLESDTILRDIMNQGLVMTEDTVITVYLQEGNYNKTTAQIDWGTDLDEIVKLELKSGATTATGTDNNVQIITYNMDAANATDPNGADYHPHAVDITGYDFFHWYISEDHMGYKMVVTITRVEATDDVVWGRSTATNNEQSGLWLPADENGDRELLLPFDQPTTIFVERAYVLDYGKEFTLSNWYFDDDAETGKEATPIHLDFDITDGMNGFDVNAPTTQNGKGDTKYGNVRLENGKVTYNPTTMNWGGADSFYVFGNTWRKTVLAQDANENGNLWNKVTVIPANNIYYEDSFITTESATQNGIEGFTFTGDWSV